MFVPGSYDATAGTVSCISSAVGTFIAVQYVTFSPPPPRSPPPPFSPSPAPGYPGTVQPLAPSTLSPPTPPLPAAVSSPVPSPSTVTPSPDASGSSLSDNQKQVALKFAGASYADLSTNASASTTFGQTVVNATLSYLVNTLGYNSSETTVSLLGLAPGSRRSLLQSSVTANLLVTLPPGTSSAAATASVNSFVAAVQAGGVFSPSFLSAFGITGVTGTIVNPGPTAGPTGSPTSPDASPSTTSANTAIIVGCVVGILGSAIVAALVAFVVIRRRRMNVGPSPHQVAPTPAVGEAAA